jgi:hypothetical protein
LWVKEKFNYCILEPFVARSLRVGAGASPPIIPGA